MAKSKTNLMTASRYWAEKPADDRFWGLHDLGALMNGVRRRSEETTTPVGKVRAMVGDDGAELCLTGRNGPVHLTHWSTGQLCRYVEFPADALRRLKPTTAALVLNERLGDYDDNTMQLLLHRNNDAGTDKTLRAVTSQYERLWNADVVRGLDVATNMGWMVPPARPAPGIDDARARPATAEDIVPGQENFGLSVKVGDMIAPAGVYASEGGLGKDMFVFMVNPNRTIDIGSGDALMRGIFVWNSEVGAGSLRIMTFYLESVCGNHICWGASKMREIRIPHRGQVIRGMRHSLPRQLHTLTDANTTAETNMVRAARDHEFGKDREETVEVLFNNKVVGLSKAVITSGYDTAVKHEHTAGAPPTSAWGIAHGLTRFSQTVEHADTRAAIDAGAGRIIDLAVKAAS